MFLDYVRTDKGREELKKRSKRLNARQRALLLIIEQASTESQSISQPWEHLATVENINCLLEFDFIQSAQHALPSTNSSAVVEVAVVAASENLSSTFDSTQIISRAKKDKLIQPQSSTIVVEGILASSADEVIVDAADKLIAQPELPASETELTALASDPTIDLEQTPFIRVEEALEPTADEVVVDATDKLIAQPELPASETEITALANEPTIEPEQTPFICVEEALEPTADEVVADLTDKLIAQPELPAPEIELTALASEPTFDLEQTPFIRVEEALEPTADEVVVDATDDTVDVAEEESTLAIKSPEELLIEDFEQSLTHLKTQPVVSKEARAVCSAKKTPNLMDDEEDFLVADEILINGKKPRYDAIPVLTWQVEES